MNKGTLKNLHPLNIKPGGDKANCNDMRNLQRENEHLYNVLLQYQERIKELEMHNHVLKNHLRYTEIGE